MNDLTPDGMPDLRGPIGARHGDTAAAPTPNGFGPAAPTRSGTEHTGQPCHGCSPGARLDRLSPAATLLMTTDPSTFATVLDMLTEWDA